MLGQQLERALGQRIALVDPELPADVGMNVVRLESHGLEDPQGLFVEYDLVALLQENGKSLFRSSAGYVRGVTRGQLQLIQHLDAHLAYMV